MTHAGLDRHRRIAVAELGRTGLHVSQAGFGCYRISAGVAEHAAALQHALVSGIDLIDTSANYADGGSEELVGQVLAHMVDSGELRREAVVVVSKAGYLQGKNYTLSQERKRLGRPFPELVPYADGLEHCIHPEFLEDQLTRALERLRLETIDVYLLHNPEYYLGWAAHNGLDSSAARSNTTGASKTPSAISKRRSTRGRIRWYGISSNTFPAPASDPQFTCLERVWEMAESINPEHHFGVVQLPMNLYEDGAVLLANQPCGMTALEFARQKNLGVLINRPLNAFTENRLLRLADADAAESLPADEIEKRIETITSALAAADPDWGGNASLSQLAVRALRSTAGISCVLVGMRRTAYVDDILTELATPVARKDRRTSWRKLHQSL